jgi:hypothetical protein
MQPGWDGLDVSLFLASTLLSSVVGGFRRAVNGFCKAVNGFRRAVNGFCRAVDGLGFEAGFLRANRLRTKRGYIGGERLCRIGYLDLARRSEGRTGRDSCGSH